jgi:hypothetical protein
MSVDPLIRLVDRLRKAVTFLRLFPIDERFREVEATGMHTTPRLLDVVALLSDIPGHGLLRGQVGTVVELLDGAYEVEFSDDEGKTHAELALAPDQLLVLHHRPQQAE